MSINLKKRFLTSSLLFILILVIYKSNFFLLYSLIIFGILSIIEFMNVSKIILKKSIFNFLMNLFFILYIFIFCLLTFIFVNFIQLKILFFALLLCCIASDLGGYTIGKIFKGPKLTSISPNKTISGSIGSVLFSIITLTFFLFLFYNTFNYKIIIIGAITSIFCQLGDLLFSFLKRKAKIKDTGNILPGHGGVLDRLDGIIIGVPSGFLFFNLIY